MVIVFVVASFFVGFVAARAALASVVVREPKSVPTPKEDEWDVDVEVLFVPPSGDWEGAIQKQLDAIEDRSPTNELVSATGINGRLVLFYKRRK